MSAHTPGPWAWHGEGWSGVYSRETHQPAHGARTCEECGHDANACGPSVFVAVTPEVARDIIDGAFDVDETDRPKPADMRLIAAAPELLAALKLCAAVCAGETMNKNGLIDALTAARAAIAKATGETA